MSAQTKKLAILFADIVGSTRLYDTLGDERARQIVSVTLDLLAEVVARYKGTVIKMIGDEIMCTFDDVETATKAACDMQETMEEAIADNVNEVPVTIRVGYHFGPCVLEDGDVHGDAVNVSARMASQAKSRQIITTADSVKLLPAMLRDNARVVDYASIKGKGEMEIAEIIWQEEDVTRMQVDVASVSASMGQSAHLQLAYQDSVIQLNHDRESAILGRSATCDIPVAEALASRQHVRIELRRDRFVLIDQSTNGTYVQLEGAEPVYVRRDEMVLTGTGVISLGRALDNNPQELIRFQLEG
ncbi:adenylate/guanylate cyclase domain-containing protein [Saccharospirillum sp. MSK14-1]|uniref:adenylate/guanylate cyclase domain-containing protein n=1 Tax=Saccharospirillum sp. MSK14-1 TaxID=1897632 RepID=UPI000D3881A9|nr:adenylate/guanylate cyclase domain-containing protein [Saccharospirillum sp. MSK14-1]